MHMSRKLGKPTLSEDAAARVVAAMRRALAERYDFNQAALARAIGLSPASVSNILNGVNKPSIETVQALGEVLREDYRQWLDTPAVSMPPERPLTEPPASEVPEGMRPYYTRDQFADLLDPAMEALIREDGCSASDARATLEAVVAFNTAKGTRPELADVLQLARTWMKSQARDSGKVRRKGKHT